MDVKKLGRVIDANFNRSKEGLRVCEDFCRFVLDDKVLTKTYKEIRHQLTDIVESLGVIQFILERNIEGDVGKKSVTSEQNRKSFSDVFYANAQRIKESVRVLEEFAKLKNNNASENLKKLRYQIYAVEKKVVKKF